MLKIDGIVTFVTVAEAGSISEAARRLRLSKSVVSERLSEMEKALGATLLHRTTRRLTLTEDGAAFLQRATRIAQEVREAAADLAERRGTLMGPLRIAAPVTFGRLHLGPALYPFLAEHPEIELTLDLDDRRVDAASDGYDAIIRHGLIADSRLVAWKLARSRRLLVASPDYLSRCGKPASLSDLEDHRGIFYTNRGVADWRFEGPEGAVVIRGKLALGVNNGDVLHDAAIAGLGVALLPAFIAGPSVREGRLVEIDVGYRPEPEFIFMAHPEGRNPSAKLRAMADHLKKAFGDPPYWEREQFQQKCEAVLRPELRENK
ncbi:MULTISPECIES: LysR family transcriptional regulator [Rhizobium]|uniref:HTH-type transcriptional regulator TtuA n=1 Tax=Rhizobium tropici TaxID=398 RepID=A0A6P1C5T3_RHITR|nr:MULTISPECIES: LysR family transcriptional regulator [Rhizobium]AGB69840.1 transcriptional regulator, LysR family [Rhizobium tropici CIAT 899]MBB4239768.1 DNA-binding transcriptional LysR family regulator [Rhizobium tropici]MBB5591038.1 DNA-binding transcriptional LysR family regulator [Rhizobium tropici]MBB6489753.1 DNA-binding transcriptional LysR family regulator [Rhizobium tropici]NEV12077.1 LysR family transcriptional regulator [Rhizobium tropici]